MPRLSYVAALAIAIGLSAKPLPLSAQAPIAWMDTWGGYEGPSSLETVAAAPLSGGTLAAGYGGDPATVINDGLVAFFDERSRVVWTYRFAPSAGTEATVRGLVELAADTFAVTYTERYYGQRHGRAYAAIIARGSDDSVRRIGLVDIGATDRPTRVDIAVAIPGTRDFLVAGDYGDYSDGAYGGFLQRVSPGQAWSVTAELPYDSAIALRYITNVVAAGDSVYVQGVREEILAVAADLSVPPRAIPLSWGASVSDRYDSRVLAMAGEDGGGSTAVWVYRSGDSAYVTPLSGAEAGGSFAFPLGVNGLVCRMTAVTEVDEGYVVYEVCNATYLQHEVSAPGRSPTTKRYSLFNDAFYPVSQYEQHLSSTLLLDDERLLVAGMYHTDDTYRSGALARVDFRYSTTRHTLAARLPSTDRTDDGGYVQGVVPGADGGIRVVQWGARGPILRDYDADGAVTGEYQLPAGSPNENDHTFLPLGGGRFAYTTYDFRDPQNNHVTVVGADGRVEAWPRFGHDFYPYGVNPYLFERPGGYRLVLRTVNEVEKVDLDADFRIVSRQTVSGATGRGTAIVGGRYAIVADNGRAITFFADTAVMRLDLEGDALDYRYSFEELGIGRSVFHVAALADDTVAVYAHTDEGITRTLLTDRAGVVGETVIEPPGFNSSVVAFDGRLASPALDAGLLQARRQYTAADGLPAESWEGYLALPGDGLDPGGSGEARLISAPELTGFELRRYREYEGVSYLVGEVGTRLARRNVVIAYRGQLSPTAVEALRRPDGLRVFPNPASSGGVIGFSGSETPSSVTVTDLGGRRVATLPVGSGGAAQLPRLPPGLYLLSGEVGGEARVGRLIVK